MRDHGLWKWRGFLGLALVLAAVWMALRLLPRPGSSGDIPTLQMLILALGVGAAVITAILWSWSIVRGGTASESRQRYWTAWLEGGWQRFVILFRSNRGEVYYRWAMKTPYLDRALACLEEAARRGYPEAFFELGLFYDSGAMGDGGRNLALKHFRKAAELGHGEAAFHLAEMLRWGRSGPKDSRAAHHWYLRSAHRGFAPAMAWLATAFEQGDGIEADPEAAAHWQGRLQALGVVPGLRKSTLGQGHVDALQRVQNEVRKGWLESMEALESQKGFHHFARYSAWSAQILLLCLVFLLLVAIFLFSGLFIIPAIVSIVGLTMLHLKLRRECRLGRSSRRLLAAAEKGDPQACFRLGMAFQEGREQMPRDPVEAVLWLRKAAEGGHIEAMSELGDLLAWGPAGVRNIASARHWLQQAAEAGNAKAQTRLGRMTD